MSRLSVYERRRLKAEAESLEHQMTHEPMNPFCAECYRAKMQKSQARKKSARGAALGPPPENFGDQVTADSLFAADAESVGLDDDSCALLRLDRGTEYIDAFPMADKTAESCGAALLDFAGPNDYISELYTDGAPELIRAAQDAKWISSCCLLYTSPSPRDRTRSRMPSSA